MSTRPNQCGDAVGRASAGMGGGSAGGPPRLSLLRTASISDPGAPARLNSACVSGRTSGLSHGPVMTNGSSKVVAVSRAATGAHVQADTGCAVSNILPRSERPILRVRDGRSRGTDAQTDVISGDPVHPTGPKDPRPRE